ncbi:ABC transporter ATP-binding protein [Nocardioides bruguierae]|uniref:ATP-binding cassette domain-containing protein n=1 Tax=Nocardioides bruguierae TaxID=2945102 RepID=A0A9X2D694_9ACTN|nr:ATP-binding cassette domain-containing protein [Nocardioides bruguierae]MCM0619968.1 ATP-binding cassette domain-containing protein [Nocardioides bruguierae]
MTPAPPPDAPVLEAVGLTKDFGAVRAVDDLSFAVAPGRVTGFLGPNGAGKTTTLRMLLGLVRPSAGRGLVGGRPYGEHPAPARLVGVCLDAGALHPGRTALGHLRVAAAPLGLPETRVREVLALVGLEAVARRRVGGFSLGMKQRLGLAVALLADPAVLVLDEPANGLDPEGIVWLRSLLRSLAGQGRTVLVSSHVLREVEHTVDDVVVVASGRLVVAEPLVDLARRAEPATLVLAPDAAGLAALARSHGWTTAPDPATGGVVLAGAEAAGVGAAAHAAGLELHRLEPRGSDLESVFLRLTQPGPDPGESPDPGQSAAEGVAR